MPIDRKRFTAAFLVANVFLTGVLAGLVSAGVGVAVPIAGASGFTVAFDELEGNGFEQYAAMESHEGCDQYPVSETRIDNGTIEGLHLFKDLEMPVTNDTVRVSIESDHMEFRGLTQRFTHLEGDIAFEGDQLVEYDDENDRMHISARNITIQNGTIRTENQYITHLSLDNLSVDVVTNPDDAGVDTPPVTCHSENESANTAATSAAANGSGSERSANDAATNDSSAAAAAVDSQR